jgi:hypothetical protein
MIALLIGGTVVLCVGVLTIVFGIPIKEFSFGNTMILAGAVVACTGLVLMGLYFVGRELRNLTRRLESGLPAQAPGAFAPSREVGAVSRGRNAAAPPAQPKAMRVPPARDEMLFPRDPQSGDFDAFNDETDHALPSANSPSLSAPWQDEPPVRTRAAPPVDAGERQRRDILFSSKRRDADDVNDFSNGSAGPDSGNSFESAWPQSDRPRSESPSHRNGRSASASPRRGDAASVSIVKSGVVDSMAYSLYSDGSIEAQMPEGMVRFSSIEELRSHLDQRH